MQVAIAYQQGVAGEDQVEAGQRFEIARALRAMGWAAATDRYCSVSGLVA